MSLRSRYLKDYQLLPDALSGEDALIKRLPDQRIAVFLDYDGTLTPISPHPEEALLSSEMRATIQKLSQQTVVGVVSGRDKKNIQELVAVPNLFYIGNHGFDIEGPPATNLGLQVGVECLPMMEKCYRELQSKLMDIPGVQFEPKRLTITIHYRFVEEKNVHLVYELMRQVVEQYPQLKMSGGKKVLEVRPNIDWNKGRAVLWVCEKLGLLKENPYFILYLGDDLTDEDAFRVLPDSGAGILVGNHSDQTFADYHLRDPSQVKLFLDIIQKRR
jgi:trehalose 6-phosphate phosphatase